jgi:hypothetical protein
MMAVAADSSYSCCVKSTYLKSYHRHCYFSVRTLDLPEVESLHFLAIELLCLLRNSATVLSCNT